MKAKRQKPLAVIGRDPRAEIHRAKFRPFESIKYLNAAALKEADKALITKVKPVGCIDCAKASTKSRSRKPTSRGSHRKLMREVLGIVRVTPPSHCRLQSSADALFGSQFGQDRSLLLSCSTAISTFACWCARRTSAVLSVYSFRRVAIPARITYSHAVFFWR